MIFNIFAFFFFIHLLFYPKVGNSIKFIRKFLTKSQWNSIDKILINNNTPINIKKQVYIILFKYYEQWAFTKAYQFKNLHQYKCSHISLIELNTYASLGLYKSIIKYKANLNNNLFTIYAEKYIYFELLNAITELHPISTISKRIRRKGYSVIENKPKSKLQLIGENDWIFDKINKNKIKENIPNDLLINKDKYNLLWFKINQLNYFEKRIISLKYNYYFEIIRSNKKISEIMNCSEEWIRQNIVKIINNLVYKKLD